MERDSRGHWLPGCSANPGGRIGVPALIKAKLRELSPRAVEGYLPADAAREIYGSDPNVRTAGALRPSGNAMVVDGGYRVSGRWQLGSGCQHSKWLVGGCRIMEGNEARLRPDGTPINVRVRCRAPFGGGLRVGDVRPLISELAVTHDDSNGFIWP